MYKHEDKGATGIMRPLSDINGHNFSLEGLWWSLARNKLLLHIIDICSWHRLPLTMQSHKKKITLAMHGHISKQRAAQVRVNVSGELFPPSVCSRTLAEKPLWIPWENMAAKALHHTPWRTTAPISFLQPAPLRKPVGVCMCVCEKGSEKKRTETVIYPHIQDLSLANFSHLRSPHKFDSHGASC